MRLISRSSLVCAVFVFVAACGDSDVEKGDNSLVDARLDASVWGDGEAPRDTKTQTDAPVVVSSKDAATDAAAQTQFKRFPIDGVTELVGSFVGSCTHEEPVPGDRWCAFSRRAAQGNAELWVINVSALSKRDDVRCNGLDSRCMKLSDHLWVGKAAMTTPELWRHSFDGDTLIFSADAPVTSGDTYQGPIYAWRPGWPKGRQISTNKGVSCWAHFQGQVAGCIDNIALNDTQPFEFDLLAGPLSSAQGDKGLPRIDRIYPGDSTDVDRWQVDFSRDAKHLCYSTGRPSSQGRNLWCFSTESLEANAVASGVRKSAPLLFDVANWQFARDGKRLYFLSKDRTGSLAAGNGSLMMVDFPSGANVTTLAENVGDFVALSDGSNNDKGIGMIQNRVNRAGTFRLIRDRDAPSNVLTIAEGVESAVLSADLRYTYFSHEGSFEFGLHDANIAMNDTATKDTVAKSCVLQETRTAGSFGSPFLLNAGLVFWAKDVDEKTNTGTGMVANIENCQNKRPFAIDIDFWFPIGEGSLLYSDDLNAESVSIRHVRVPSGKTWPGTDLGMPLVTRVQRNYSMTLPAYDLLIFQTKQGTNADGIYLTKLPTN
jgi:hypothetical protein